MELYEKYVGRVFDNRYRMEKLIGIGGMSIVFKATDLLMRRTVAVKILKDEIAADEQSVKRFINESKAVAMLSHQNIVNIYDISVRENIKYIVMEFVEGITLKNYMQHREVLNLREIISYTTQILRALDHAHKKGVVHRDIKPQNIMLLKNGIIKVMDFGIAKLPNTETVTMTEKAIGTVYYISPEQVSGGEIDSRSDIYSLGVMMYEMATGQLPFTAETPVSVALMQVNDAPTQPRNLNSHIPIGLEQIIMRAMEKVPGERYQSAEEMLGHLLKLRENPKIIFRENRTAKDKKKEADEAKPRRRASRSMFPIIIGVTMAFLIVAGISGYYILDKLFLNSTMNDYENVEIENFVGATYTLELDAWFEKSEYFEMPTIEYEYNDKIGKGRIISQNPLPKEIRKVLPGKQKCEISFVVSLGEKTFTLEDYTVRDYRVVETELRRLGLRVTVDNVESDVFDIGAVVKTEPAAGTVVKEDDHVTIYVSVGVKTAKTTVPNFVGLNEAEALVLLMESKLSAGEVKYVKGSYAVGTVVEQTIPAWTEAIQHTKVGFTVCGGESYSGDGTSLPTEDDMKPIEPDPIEPDPVDPDDPDNPVDPDDPNIDDTDPDETDDPFDWGNTDDSGYDNPVFKDPDDWFNGGIWGGSDFYGNGYVP